MLYNVHYVVKQLFRTICLKGERVVAVHIDYVSTFDSFSHIYLFYVIKKAGDISKIL